MMAVTVTRGPGDRPMPDVVDTLLAGSETAMRSRANAELDSVWPAGRVVEVEIVPQSNIRPGMIVCLQESGQPERHALVKRVQIDLRRSDASGALERRMTLTVEYRI